MRIGYLYLVLDGVLLVDIFIGCHIGVHDLTRTYRRRQIIIIIHSLLLLQVSLIRCVKLRRWLVASAVPLYLFLTDCLHEAFLVIFTFSGISK